jgi:hypothetical protein
VEIPRTLARFKLRAAPSETSRPNGASPATNLMPEIPRTQALVVRGVSERTEFQLPAAVRRGEPGSWVSNAARFIGRSETLTFLPPF